MTGPSCSVSRRLPQLQGGRLAMLCSCVMHVSILPTLVTCRHHAIEDVAKKSAETVVGDVSTMSSIAAAVDGMLLH